MQKEALQSVLNNPSNSILTLCTGSGKSKIAIDLCQIIAKDYSPKILLVVPTEKLRDINWKKEFYQWDAGSLYNDSVVTYCYASINKIKQDTFDLVILDEIHNITENNSEFFKNNKVKKILGLTATYPRDETKVNLLSKLNFKITYTLSLDEAVKRQIVAPYKIKVIEMFLDNKDKYVEAGNKKKRFYVTEQGYYDYLSKTIMKMIYANLDPKFLFLKRMRFLYNLKSKTELAKKVLSKIDKDEKTIIFCGSIDQAKELCKDTFHSKTNDTALLKFMKNKIKRLSCVKALNEGMDISLLDAAVVVQLDSNDLNLIQRIGRVTRYRDGHIAEIYILSVLNTQDEKWVEKALKSFDKNNIEYINAKNF